HRSRVHEIDRRRRRGGSVTAIGSSGRQPFGLSAYLVCLQGIVWRESLRFLHQRERFISALVRPLVWLFIFAAGFRQTLGISILQVYAYLVIAYFWEIEPPSLWGYVTILPALVLSGLMLGALGMVLSSLIKQLENFAGVMNFVIFPMFFASSALYPLWRVQEGSPMLYYVCLFNPFTHAVELIRFALYGKMNWVSLAVVGGCTAVFMIRAVFAFDPSRGLLPR